VSRRVRLRRTLVGATLLVVLGAIGVRSLSVRDVAEGAADSADRLPGVAASVAGAPQGTPTPTRSSTTPDAQDGSTTTEAPAPHVPQNGTGRLVVVPVTGPQSSADGREITYTVEIEQGLGVDAATVARTIRATLLDSRGWQRHDGVRFVNISPAQARTGRHVDIRVTLASPGMTDRLCAPLRTFSQVSCWNGERSVLNLRRWQLGDDSYGRNVARYRTYLINHEVGHGLGHQHRTCPGKGKRAPVMVQQTLSLGGCVPWPFPSGA
jgi:hypothetical protein